MKDNKQLNQLVYLKPEIELVHMQQEKALLGGSEGDGPIVVVEPETEENPKPNPGPGGFDITVVPPVQLPPEDPFDN